MDSLIEKTANEDEPRGLEVEVVASDVQRGFWVVEAIDTSRGGDGDVYLTTFAGPGARQRAHAYAATLTPKEPNVIEKLQRILDRDNGHCGESTLERISRKREQQPIRDAIAELTRLTADNAAKDQRIADLEGALDQIQGAFDLKDAINLARATLNATPKEG